MAFQCQLLLTAVWFLVLLLLRLYVFFFLSIAIAQTVWLKAIAVYSPQFHHESKTKVLAGLCFL